MKTSWKLLTLPSILILCLMFCVQATALTRKSWWSSQGQGFELMSREDPRSPFFHPTDSRSDVLLSAISRSWNRLVALNYKVAKTTSRKNSKFQQPRPVSFYNKAFQEPDGGGVSAPPSTGAQEYFVSLKVGTPPKEVLLTIDTGSELTWTQCTPCVFCYDQLLPIFSPSTSKTYLGFDCQNSLCNNTGGVLAVCSVGDNSCAYEAAYGDGSFTIGTLSSETFTFSSENGRSVAVPNLIFGCGRYNEGLFVGNSGLLGLDRGTFSFATQLQGVFGHRFSLCYTDRLQSPNATSFLYFGETNLKGLSFTPLQIVPGGSDLYYLNFTGVSVGKTKLNFNPSVLKLDANGTGGSVLDSGTYITFLPDVVYTPLKSTFLKLSKLTVAPLSNNTLGLDFCFNIHSYPPKIPTVTFHLENVDLAFDVDNILIGPFDTQGELYCFAFMNSGPISGSIAVIIGNVQQQNFRIEYDLEKSRIGFKKVDCAAT